MLIVQGVYVGSRSVPYGNEGKSRTEIGIQTQEVDGFGQAVSSNTIVRVSASRLSDVSHWDALKGQPVSVPVYVQAFPSRSGAGFCFWLQNNAAPTPMTALVKR